MSEDVLFDCDDQMYPNYKLKVVRDVCGGRLTVSFKGRVFHDQIVPLAYGAQFGPDVMDLGAWGHIACIVVDKHRADHARTQD
jgi:hypothetical protein